MWSCINVHDEFVTWHTYEFQVVYRMIQYGCSCWVCYVTDLLLYVYCVNLHQHIHNEFVTWHTYIYAYVHGVLKLLMMSLLRNIPITYTHMSMFMRSKWLYYLHKYVYRLLYSYSFHDEFVTWRMLPPDCSCRDAIASKNHFVFNGF